MSQEIYPSLPHLVGEIEQFLGQVKAIQTRASQERTKLRALKEENLQLQEQLQTLKDQKNLQEKQFQQHLHKLQLRIHQQEQQLQQDKLRFTQYCGEINAFKKTQQSLEQSEQSLKHTLHLEKKLTQSLKEQLKQFQQSQQSLQEYHQSQQKSFKALQQDQQKNELKTQALESQIYKLQQSLAFQTEQHQRWKTATQEAQRHLEPLQQTYHKAQLAWNLEKTELQKQIQELEQFSKQKIKKSEEDIYLQAESHQHSLQSLQEEILNLKSAQIRLDDLYKKERREKQWALHCLRAKEQELNQKPNTLKLEDSMNLSKSSPNHPAYFIESLSEASKSPLTSPETQWSEMESQLETLEINSKASKPLQSSKTKRSTPLPPPFVKTQSDEIQLSFSFDPKAP